MECIIIDDEKTSRIIINQLCESLDSLEIKAEFSNAIDAIKYLNKYEVDLVFLDIHMPGFNGFDFLQTLKTSPKIILTTSDTNYALKAFEYDNIVDYLVKPITQDRFTKAVLKAEALSDSIKSDELSVQSKLNSGDDELFVNINGRLVKLRFDEIILVEAKGDYILIKTDNENFTIHSTMKKIEEKLPVNSFLKVHRSFVINTSKIIDIENNSVLIGKNVVPVSRSNRSELMKRLNLL
ncbi:LytR/AlgR family response regulator transcription factor [Ulvibacter antarcticus]|uniref:LytTR family two component transcriptional regulator n=1 Tax=Ulvibacter antarcticus TaxID=442714 RepID=A0A3L9Z338_9FLAO|nr:LytTR family DNA-binding domain-containing protein [Ulvibacter antarcticus]RMA66417.1 LytTR family two component transcriptional regulator [Ulvibacter antarcticus]